MIPDEAELHADQITEETDPELLEEVTMTINRENRDESITPVFFYVYDVYFTVDGEEIYFIPNPALGLWIDKERFNA